MVPIGFEWGLISQKISRVKKREWSPTEYASPFLLKLRPSFNRCHVSANGDYLFPVPILCTVIDVHVVRRGDFDAHDKMLRKSSPIRQRAAAQMISKSRAFVT